MKRKNELTKIQRKKIFFFPPAKFCTKGEKVFFYVHRIYGGNDFKGILIVLSRLSKKDFIYQN